MKGTVVVTGGAGFVGSHLVESLLDDGHHVTVFDALKRPGSQLNLKFLRDRYRADQLKFVQGDVGQFGPVMTAMREADIIYHLAGQVAVTSSVSDPRSDFETNALGTLNVLEAARRSGRPPSVGFT